MSGTTHKPSRKSWLIPIAAMLCISATAPSDDILKQKGPWKMDYATNACHLTAKFGDGASGVEARFSRFGPEDGFRVALMGARLGHDSALRTRALLEFRPTATGSALRDVTNGSVGPKGARVPVVFSDILRFDNRTSSPANELPAVTPEAEKAVGALYVKLSGREPFTLDLVSMGAPMVAMRACTDDLVRSWGFDPAELATRQKRAVPTKKPHQWAEPDDYPFAMLARGSSAIVDFRLAIDENGAVTDCFVLGSTTPATIGPYSCGVFKRRARFAPSLDKDGNTAKDFYINRVFWRVS